MKRNEVEKILSNEFDRILFFKDYQYFSRDGNEDLYKRFISKVLAEDNDVDVTSDAIYLAININFFSPSLLAKIKAILFSRRQYLVKLSCLDYLTHFKKYMSVKSFVKTNEYLLARSTNILLKIQAITNLLFKYAPLFDSLIMALEASKGPTEFYRAMNGLSYNSIKLNSEQLLKLERITREKKFGTSVQRELIKKIKSMGN
jgi:hypothetical protein